MKKILLPVVTLAACVLSAQAQFFTNGNLAVLRIGGPGQSVTTSDNGNSVWIDQYSTNGTLVNSFLIPSNGPNALIMDGEPYDGLMSLTPDGTHLVIAGFNTATPYISNGIPANFAFTASTNVPRAIATVDGYGNYALPVVNSNMFNTYSITSAASDGSNFWATGTGSTGGTSGLVYCGTATAPATNQLIGAAYSSGSRSLNIYNGGLYLTAYPSNTTTYPNAGAFLIGTAGGALPTNATTMSVAITTGTAAASTPSDFVINPAGTIAYVADSSLGIIKFSNGGSGWVSNYTIIPTNTGYASASGSSHALSVTADFTQTPPVVYATTAETITNRLVMFQDTGATATVINLASNVNVSGVGGMTNTFRGVRFAPGSYPVISSPPLSVVTSAGGVSTATFTTSATGTGPLTFQWYTNGVAVSGATSTSFTLNDLTTAMNGTSVDVVVTGPFGTATSQSAGLTITPYNFTTGNIAVLRIGGAGESVTTSDNGNSVEIDQYTPGGTLVSSYLLPSNGPNALIMDGEPYDGLMSMTPDGTHLVIAGFNTGMPYISNGIPANFAFASSTNVPRAIATVDGYGNYALPIVNSNMYNTFSITSGTSDGSNYWATGTGGTASACEVIYCGTATAPATNQILAGIYSSGSRSLNIYNGGLYVTAYPSNTSTYPSAGAFLLANSGGALPTNTTTASLAISTGTAAASTPSDFVMNSAGTIAYVADSSLGIIKFSNGGSGWVSNYTIIPTNTGYASASGSSHALSVTADFTQTPAVVYATTAETITNRLVMFQDTGALPTIINLASNVNVAGAGGMTNTFRGVRLIPGIAPVITTNPASVTVNIGDNASFTVGATGSPTLAYQWYTNFVAVAGATSSTFTLSDIQGPDNGMQVYAVVSSQYGSATSASATISINGYLAPTITSVMPSSQTVNATSNASFTVNADNAAAYFWYFDGAPLANGGNISGANSATLQISDALEPNSGSYLVIVSNSFSTATSSVVTLTVTDPIILVPPMGTTNLPGSTYTFTVTALGSTPLTYAWLTNGVQDTQISPSSSTFTITNAGSQYTLVTVVVSNVYGAWVSSAGTNSGGTGAPVIFDVNPYLISDDFNYANGNITPQSPWGRHSGSANDSFATNVVVTDIFGNTGSNGVYYINQNQEDDIQREFSAPLPIGGPYGANIPTGPVYASFSIDMTQLPANQGGTYFAHFCDTNEFNTGPEGFFSRIFALTTNTAVPGTYRLGIANGQGDYSTTSSLPSGPAQVIPQDLALGIPYQVVVEFLYDNFGMHSTLWINPETTNGLSVTAQDAPTETNYTAPLMYFDFRQNGGEGVMYIDNLRVAQDFPDVTTNIAAFPIIGMQPTGFTNFAGNPTFLEVAATGKGVTYQWFKDDSSVGNTGTNALYPLPNENSTDSGTYTVVCTTDAGSVTSSNAIVSVSDVSTPPYITTQPTNTTNILGSQATFTVVANGTGPLSYQWYFTNTDGNSGSLGDNGITVIGAYTARLFLNHLTTNDQQSYYVIVTGGDGSVQSSAALLTVSTPPFKTIAYLRGLMDPNTFTVTDTSFYAVEGTVTTYTNVTSGNTASYYLQDATGGIDLFVTGDDTFRPLIGSDVIAAGTLDVFDNELELEVSAFSGSDIYFINTYTNGSNIINNLPAAIVMPLDYLNLDANQYSLVSNVDGSVIMLTNVTFQSVGSPIFTNTVEDYPVGNNLGTLTLFLDTQVTNLYGLTIPTGACTITGPLIRHNTGWEMELTSIAQIVTNPPPPIPYNAFTASLVGGYPVLTWPVVPYNYAYTVLESPTLTGPYEPIGGYQISPALVFTNGTGMFTDTNAPAATKFYEIVSP
ncbi:MAG TPA: immunoglobulin domain-containing protein [Verrucomicrobiae bacterium]|nr:immunoglobulin domain-containing protein [Verrucomicrobiae bacterium]